MVKEVNDTGHKPFGAEAWPARELTRRLPGVGGMEQSSMVVWTPTLPLCSSLLVEAGFKCIHVGCFSAPDLGVPMMPPACFEALQLSQGAPFRWKHFKK